MVITTSKLKGGESSQCKGCSTRRAKATHGLSRTAIYGRWRDMMSRTTRPTSVGYQNYGGRGIKVCDAWLDPRTFIADMGPTFLPELELDRIDVNGNYEPSNCRWVTRRVNAQNKRATKLIEWAGESHTFGDWGSLLGITASVLRRRLGRGWSIDRAFTVGADPEALDRLGVARSSADGGSPCPTARTVDAAGRTV